MNVAMWTSWETRCGIAAYTGALVAELRSLGVKLDVVPVPYADRDPASASETIERLNAADLVHVQHEYTFWGGVVPGASSLTRYYREMRKPRVVTAHTVFTAGELLGLPNEERPRQRLAKELLSRYPPYRNSLERAPFRGAGAVIVHTDAAKERLAARGIPRERLHVLPAGTPPAAPAPAPEEVARMRARFRLEGSRVVSIFGYVTPNKGYELAMEALKLLPPAVKLLIAGGARVEAEAPYLESLRSDIRNRGLEDRVAITGYLEDAEVAAAMALTDLVLVPHTAANGSYSVTMGLGYAKPVVASDLACFKEIADAHGCLELFDSEDETMLAERIGFLLASAAGRERLTERARVYAAERTWAAVAQRTLAIYNSVPGVDH